jgi:hypothetical protein
MFYACEYDASGLILEARGGRAAVAFLRSYAGTNTLRISEPHDEFPGIEVGPVHRAGWNVDGTPPAPKAEYADELDYALATRGPVQARAFIVRQMKRRALVALAPYRDAADADFGDADLLAQGRALRDELRTLIQAAAAATTEADLRAAWDSLKAKTGG